MTPAGASAADGRGKKPVENSVEKSPPPAPASAPPLKPQKKLLIILSIALAIWVAWLIGLYVRTVYPMRHGNRPTTEPHEVERE
jgi:hypothetical protein